MRVYHPSQNCTCGNCRICRARRVNVKCSCGQCVRCRHRAAVRRLRLLERLYEATEFCRENCGPDGYKDTLTDPKWDLVDPRAELRT